MTSSKHLIIFAVVLCARASTALPVYQEDDHYEGHHEHHHGPPPATSYATISTTHVKVQHPPAAPAPAKYATPYKYEYLTQPQTAYKYISLPSTVGLPVVVGQYERPRSAPTYKYLAASPTYKYVQPPPVTTEPEAAEVPTNSLKYALKYEQDAFKQEQRLAEYEQPSVQYKYVAVPSYKFVEQQASEYGEQHQTPAASYDYADDKQQYN